MPATRIEDSRASNRWITFWGILRGFAIEAAGATSFMCAPTTPIPVGVRETRVLNYKSNRSGPTECGWTTQSGRFQPRRCQATLLSRSLGASLRRSS
jgi:hypothetical protein